MKTAFISGITGQDGAYLATHLINLNYKVFGGKRRSSSPNLWRLEKLGIADKVDLVDFELLEQANIDSILKKLKPDEFYNLAAQSFVKMSFEQPLYTTQASGVSVLRILEAIRNHSIKTKFYQASTSEMFGLVQEVPQSEKTPFYPRSPYGFAKLMAHWATVNYREAHGIFACSGILFNHESPLRGGEFVTKKIVDGFKSIKRKEKKNITLGNLDAKRDWGYAGDYVKGMHLMLQQEQPGDYVLATGETYSIRNFVELVASRLGFKILWKGEGLNEVGCDEVTGEELIKVSKDFYRESEVDLLVGNPTKAREELGWTPEVGLPQLVDIMLFDN
jgi:GDPmannose 4,6-dehydratase